MRWTFYFRGRRIRTRDPRFWRPVLYQLSYTPICPLFGTAKYYSTAELKLQQFFSKIFDFLSSLDERNRKLHGRFNVIHINHFDGCMREARGNGDAACAAACAGGLHF